MKQLEQIAALEIRRLAARAEKIVGIRSPSKGEAKQAKLLQEIADQRGRPMFYPALSAGVGRGPYLELVDGSVKLDFITGIGVHLFGHSHPKLLEAAFKASLASTSVEGNLMMDERLPAFIRELLGMRPARSRLKHCFVSNSGAMANENALKILRHNDERKHVIAFKGCFHGRTQTMAELTDNPAVRQGLPVGRWRHYIPFYDLESGWTTDRVVSKLKKVLKKKNACAIVMELVQGEGGFRTAPPEFFRAVIEECKRSDVKVWIDEIQTAGRTRSFFVHEAMGLAPLVDVVTVGKMAQCGATLFTPELNPRPGLLSQTFAGGVVPLAVGTEMLRLLKHGGYFGADGKISKISEYFRSRLDDLCAAHPELIGRVSGYDGMLAFQYGSGGKTETADCVRNFFDRGLMTFYCGRGPYLIRMLPPMGVLTRRHIDEALDIVS